MFISHRRTHLFSPVEWIISMHFWTWQIWRKQITVKFYLSWISSEDSTKLRDLHDPLTSTPLNFTQFHQKSPFFKRPCIENSESLDNYHGTALINNQLSFVRFLIWTRFLLQPVTIMSSISAIWRVFSQKLSLYAFSH